MRKNKWLAGIRELDARRVGDRSVVVILQSEEVMELVVMELF